MTGPAEDAQTTVQAVQENAQRLGLTWSVRPATVATIDPVTATFDGDTEAIAMTPLIGQVGVGQRVYVFIVPPAGNYIAGFLPAGPPGVATLWTARQTTGTTTAAVTFTVPTNLRRLILRWRARCTSAGPFEQIHATINGVVTSYFAEHQQAFGAVSAAALIGANPWAFLGHVSGAGGTANVFGSGEATFDGWDIAGSFLSYTFSSGVLVSNGIWNGGSGVCSVSSPYTTLSIFPDAGASWIAGSDFQLEGIPS